jgi:RNA polymerase sigma-70 factor (ECF subfamily)
MFLLDILVWALSFGTLSVIQGENTRAEDPDEQGLLERASRADPEALGALYDRYVDRIYSYIYHRVGQADLAEDLTAQVFARMLEAIREGRAWRTSFSGWIYRIAHNLVVDHYRRRSRAAFVELEEATPIVADEADPLRKVEARLESERLRAALAKLTEEQAEVISLRFLDEFSIAEVASMMNKTEGAIKALQYRAVLALRRVMQPA